METHKEKIMNRVKRMDRFDDHHDGVEEARETLAKGAEFYENNEAENLAKDTSEDVYKIINYDKEFSRMRNIAENHFNALSKPDTQKITALEDMLSFPGNKELAKMKFVSFVELILKHTPELFNDAKLLSVIDTGLNTDFLKKEEFEKLSLKFAGKIPKLKKYIRPELHKNIRKNNFISKAKDIYDKSMFENKHLARVVKNGIKNDVRRIIDIVKKPFSFLNKKESDVNQIIRGLKNAGATFEEFKITILEYIEEGNKKWNEMPAWKKEKKRALDELEAVEKNFTETQKSGNNETKHNKTPMWELQNDLYETNDPNKASSLIDTLLSSGFMAWDDTKFWKTLMRLSNNAVIFHDKDKNLSQTEILKKVRSAVKLIWPKEFVKKWGIEDKNGELKKESRVIKMDKFTGKEGNHDNISSFSKEWKNNKVA